MKRKWGYILTYFIGAIILVLLLQTFLCSPFSIPSQGMENSLLQGDRILVNKWSYGLRKPLLSLFSYNRWKKHSINREEIVVFNNPGNFTEKVIDKKEVFINRCTATPGDTLWVDSLFQHFSPGSSNPDQKKIFSYPKEKKEDLITLTKKLALEFPSLLGEDSLRYFCSFSQYEYYLISQELNQDIWIHLERPSLQTSYPIIIPGKEVSVQVTPWNITLLRNTMLLHEKREAKICNDTLFIDSEPTEKCSFTKDYYWMSSNNALNLSDSRIFGFVPEDHIIGKAAFIWLSKEPNGNPFKGYRWSRFFTTIR